MYKEGVTEAQPFSSFMIHWILLFLVDSPSLIADIGFYEVLMLFKSINAIQMLSLLLIPLLTAEELLTRVLLRSYEGKGTQLKK